MPYDAFISHSSKDKPVADAVCDAVESRGVRCWIAPRDITPGEDWSEAIVRGITESPVTILVFSRNAAESVQVRREVERAFEKGRSVVPLRIDDVVPAGAFEYYLSSVHWLNATVPLQAGHLNDLSGAVLRLLGRQEEATGPSIQPPVEPGGARAAPPPAPPSPLRVLPASATPYIGRGASLEAWLEILLRPETRVMTLTGFGGMGKTRSALELARRGADHFRDGVCWIEMEEARTGEEMIPRLAGALRLDVQPQPSLKEQVAGYLSDRCLLVALDNTEQIPDAGVVVSELIKAAPRVKWLVTSRRPLELSAERVVEVPPLPPAEAEALFIDRAQSRAAGFSRTAENSADISEVCRRLEGLPLAIELAAARVAGMTPRDIVVHLDESFRLLQTRAPHLPLRQRAMQGAIEWSHELLEEEDRTLFAQLSVFANGFTLPVAEEICDGTDVFEGVHQLHLHSFLRSEIHDETQQMRFFMLELVREFADRKLTGHEVRRRHAVYFLGFAGERNDRLRTRDEPRALEELAVELDNLRAALRWAETQGEHEICARLALALFQPLYYRGHLEEARRCLEIGATASQSIEGDATALRAALLRQEASCAHDEGDLNTARAKAEAGLALYFGLFDKPGIADMFNLLGLIATDEGNHATAAKYYEDSLGMRPEDDHRGRAIVLHNLGLLAKNQENTSGARQRYEESLDHRRAAGDVRGEAETLSNLGVLAFEAGDFESARRLYNESLAIRRTLRERNGMAIAMLLYNLGELAEADGDMMRSVALFIHAERMFREMRSPYADPAKEMLGRLAAGMEADAFEAARCASEGRTWETAVGE